MAGWNPNTSVKCDEAPAAKDPVRNKSVIVGVEAPARQGARSAHTGSMKATSNAARRDASAATVIELFLIGS
jgi:hypothetical protein